MINYYYYACTPGDLIWTKCLSSDSTPVAIHYTLYFRRARDPIIQTNIFIVHTLAPAHSLTWLHARMPLCPGCDTHIESGALCVWYLLSHTQPNPRALSLSLSAFVCTAQNTAGCIHTPLIHSELFNKEAAGWRSNLLGRLCPHCALGELQREIARV